MGFALFIGCKIPKYAPQAEIAARRVLKRLGIKPMDMEFNCCGYPLRDQFFTSYLLAAGRNLALAEEKGLNLIALCKCCLGSLKRAQAFLAESQELRDTVQRELSGEGLTYKGTCEVKHLQSVLYHDVGIEQLEEMVVNPLNGLKVAPLYGCHALRPSRITHFDDPYQPHIIEDLLKVAGAEGIPWEGRLKCCGAALREKNPRLALDTVLKRLTECGRADADILNVDCPHSYMQAQAGLQNLRQQGAGTPVAGVAFIAQLMGLALGMSPAEVGFQMSGPINRELLRTIEQARQKEAAEAS